jgi:hypothetical protein
MGCQQTEQSQQVFESMNWYFGGRECRSVQFVDDTAGSNAGDYWDLNVIDENYDEKKYLVWKDDGVAVAPTPAADQTLVAVTYSQGDDAATQAAAFKTSLDAANVEVIIEVTGDSAEYQNRFLGAITAEVTTNAPNFTFTSHFTGFGGSIGSLSEGGAELATTQEYQNLTSDSTGTLILDKVYTGGSGTITLSLNEMTTQRWKDLIGDTFGSNVIVDTNDLVGMGDDKLYRSAFSFAGQLTGHPVRLPNSDRSADITIPKTVPVLGSIGYSGSEVQSAEFTFDALRDTSKPAGLRMWFRGDHSLV